VQQRRIRRPQRRGDRGIALMTRRTDGVVALAPRAQPARRKIEMAAAELRIEQVKPGLRTQRAARTGCPPPSGNAEMVAVKWSSIDSAIAPPNYGLSLERGVPGPTSERDLAVAIQAQQ
jgi:hypothetical protein